MISAFRHALVIGAHPDDEMACSGTIARLRECGAAVDVLTFANCADALPEGFSMDDLVGEWSSATGLLGVPRRHLAMWDIPSKHFPQHRQTILDELILRRDRDRPELVLLPAPSDIHQDHATVSAEGIRAFKHATILGYELAMNTVSGWTGSGFVRLEPQHVDLKVRHAATYRSQAHRAYMAESYIRGLAAVRGLQANAPAAEAFEVVRWMA